jgi:hypothetical protein
MNVHNMFLFNVSYFLCIILFKINVNNVIF